MKNDRSNPTANVCVEFAQIIDPFFRAEPKVANPSSEVTVYVLEAGVQRLTPRPRSQLPDAGIHTHLSPGRDCNRYGSIRAFAQMETEEGHVIRLAHGALCLVHFQTKSSFDEPTHRLHDAMTGTFASHEHAEVIRVAHESKPSTGQLPIQFIKDNVGKERRKRATLWCPFFRSDSCSIWQYHVRLEHPVYELQDTSIRDMLCQTAEQPLMVDTIEELREIDIDRDCISCSQILLCLGDGGGSSSTRPKAVTAVMKRWFKDGPQHLERRLLNDSIHNVRNTEPPLPASGLGDPYPADVARLVTSRK